MKERKKKRYAVTLVEMIIVMILIATITGALAYNFQGSLTQGKVFKTKQNIKRLETILLVYFAESPTKNKNNLSQADLKEIVIDSPLAPQKGNDVLRDGWGDSLTVEYKTDANGNDAFVISSTHVKSSQ